MEAMARKTSCDTECDSGGHPGVEERQEPPTGGESSNKQEKPTRKESKAAISLLPSSYSLLDARSSDQKQENQGWDVFFYENKDGDPGAPSWANRRKVAPESAHIQKPLSAFRDPAGEWPLALQFLIRERCFPTIYLDLPRYRIAAFGSEINF